MTQTDTLTQLEELIPELKSINFRLSLELFLSLKLRVQNQNYL